MRTRAAMLRKAGTPWEVTKLEQDQPRANEVLVQTEAVGLCHYNEHSQGQGPAADAGGHVGSGDVAVVFRVAITGQPQYDIPMTLSL